MLLAHQLLLEPEVLRWWMKSLGWPWRLQKAGLGGAAGPVSSLSLQEKLERVILGSKAAQEHPEEVRGLWQTCGELMFSLEPRLRHLGLGKEVRPSITRESRGSGLCLMLSRQSCSPLQASVLASVKWEAGWMECFLRCWGVVCRTEGEERRAESSREQRREGGERQGPRLPA